VCFRLYFFHQRRIGRQVILKRFPDCRLANRLHAGDDLIRDPWIFGPPVFFQVLAIKNILREIPHTVSLLLADTVDNSRTCVLVHLKRHKSQEIP